MPHRYRFARKTGSFRFVLYNTFYLFSLSLSAFCLWSALVCTPPLHLHCFSSSYAYLLIIPLISFCRNSCKLMHIIRTWAQVLSCFKLNLSSNAPYVVLNPSGGNMNFKTWGLGQSSPIIRWPMRHSNRSGELSANRTDTNGADLSYPWSLELGCENLYLYPSLTRLSTSLLRYLWKLIHTSWKNQIEGHGSREKSVRCMI